MITKENSTDSENRYDLRVVEMQLRRGNLDQKDYEAFLKKLPDEEANANYIEVWEDTQADEKTPHADALTFTSA